MSIPTVAEIDRALARSDFKEFVRQAWPILEPTTPLIWNWHMDAICDHLQAVHEKTIRNIVINIPFRLSKSILCSVMYPSWVWLRDQGHKFVCTSLADSIVVENALKMRTLILSSWYASLQGEPIKLEKDQEHYMKNQWGGHRQSYSLGSAVLGLTANTLIVDDPMSAEVVASKLERERVENRLALSFMTRITPPGQGACIIVMQRLHQEDTSGKYLKDETWDRLILPMVWDGDNRSRTALNFKDPRTTDGEILFPKYFTKDTIDRHKKIDGAQFYAGQLQQRPVSAEGSIIHYEWIRTFKELPTVIKWSISCDTAIKTGQNNDYSIIQVWALCESGYYLVDMIRKKLEYNALKTLVSATYDRYPASEVIVEDKASGQQLVQDFKTFSRIPVIPVIPLKDKGSRLQFVSSLYEAGKVFIPEGATWAADFIEEVCEFGYSKHDDIVDAMTQYLTRQMSRKNKTNVRIL